MGRVLLVLMLASTACPVLWTTHTSPWERGIEPWMRIWWHDAQNELSQLPGIKGDVFGVKIDGFMFVRREAPFRCGPVEEAVGCFLPGISTIWWYAGTPGVIKHEAQHAILWKLGDKRWSCFGHTGEPCPPE
jgi:hypothetical protein